MIYQGKDLTGLLLRTPSSLKEDEKDLIKSFYVNTGRKTVKDIITNEKIFPFSSCIFLALGIDIEFWAKEHDRYVKRNKKIVNLLNNLFEKAKYYGCNSLALTENFGSLLRSKSCIGCFTSSDVDIFADKIEKKDIILLLGDLGFILQNRGGRVENYSTQVSMFFNPESIDKGFWINILWTTTSRAFLQQKRYNERLKKERVKALPVEGTNIKVLNNTALLYYCALHIACGHYFTLSPGYRLYVDVDRIIRNCSIDWETIAQWTKEDNAGIRIALVFYLSKYILKTPFPLNFFKEFTVNAKFINLFNFLYDENSEKIVQREGKIYRLYVELSSDGNNIFRAIMSRLTNKN